MNVFSFVQLNKYFHSVKDEKCSIQLGFASLNGTFHFSPHVTPSHQSRDTTQYSSKIVTEQIGI